MERNQETLSTRDLAAANEPVAGAETASDVAREDRQPAGETPTEVYDREAAEEHPALEGPVGTDPSTRDIRSQPEAAPR